MPDERRHKNTENDACRWSWRSREPRTEDEDDRILPGSCSLVAVAQAVQYVPFSLQQLQTFGDRMISEIPIIEANASASQK